MTQLRLFIEHCPVTGWAWGLDQAPRCNDETHTHTFRSTDDLDVRRDIEIVPLP